MSLAETERRLVETKPVRVEDVRMAGRPTVRFSDPFWSDLQEVRAFLFEHMYRHPTVTQMREATSRVVSELFALYLTEPSRMLPDWAAEAEGSETHRARVVSDYISAMTDRYALEQYGIATGKTVSIANVA